MVEKTTVTCLLLATAMGGSKKRKAKSRQRKSLKYSINITQLKLSVITGFHLRNLDTVLQCRDFL